MPYADLLAITAAAGGAARLLQLVDVDQDGELDATVLAEAQAAADALIHSYAGRRFEGPVTDPMLARVAAQEVVYWLREARGIRSEMDNVTHEQNIAWLKDLAIGKVRLADPQPAASRSIRSAYFSGAETDVSRDKMKGAW